MPPWNGPGNGPAKKCGKRANHPDLDEQRKLSCRDRLGIQLVLGAAATSGRDRKVAYVANFVSGVTIDCVDPQRVARFWSALLGREPGPSQAGWVYLGHRGDPQPRLVFQPVPEPKAGKVRIHLDVTVDGVDEAIELVTSLGGRTTDERHNYNEGVVVVMADPEGHEFCLVQYYGDASCLAGY